jgi:hypothetical protein
MPLIPDSKAAQRYGVCSKTWNRWDNKPEMQLPPAEWINGRKYRDTDKLDAWDAARRARGPVKPTPRGAAAKSANSSNDTSSAPPGKTADATMHVAETEAA